MTKSPSVFTRASVTARRAGIDTRTLVSAAERGELPGLIPVQIGNLVFFRTAAVESFLASGEKQGGAL